MKIKYSWYGEVELISHYDSKKLYNIVIKWVEEDLKSDEELRLPPIEKITEDLLIAILTGDASCKWTTDFIIEHRDYYDYTLYDYLHTLCEDAEDDLLIECKQEIGEYGSLIELEREAVEED